MFENKYKSKIKTSSELLQIIGKRPRYKKVAMCHGTFDIVHPGHIRHLIYASSKADILIASLTSDNQITKGNDRPYVPQELRAINLSVLDMVDYVIIDDSKTPLKNISLLQPDIFAKGYEYNADGLNIKTSEEKIIIDNYGGQIIFTPGDIVFSSSHIIDNNPPNISLEKVKLLLDIEKITFKEIYKTLADISKLNITVVGDTIIDTYTQSELIGGQTKTPTLSVRYLTHKDYIGGAGIVSKHLASAGAKVKFITVLGKDKWLKYVINDFKENNIELHAIVDNSRPTTNKNVITNGTYKLLTLDYIDNRSISDDIIEEIKSQIHESSVDSIIFSDFRHGIFNSKSIPKLIKAIPENVIKVADSQVASRWGNILDFKGFDLITPNEREARFSLGDQDSVIRPLAKILYDKAECKNMFLKLGEKGILVYRNTYDSSYKRSFFAMDTFAGQVLDPVGAGDAMLAYGTLAYTSSKNIIISAIIGLAAAALECEFDGNIPIKNSEVLKKIKSIENKMA